MPDIAKSIEHTLLRPDTSLSDVRTLCEEAKKYGFAGVCVPPLYVRDSKRMLEDSATKIQVVP